MPKYHIPIPKMPNLLSYGTYLVDLALLRQPGIIFTIVAGIGSSAIQFAKARAQFKPLLAPHHAPQLYVHDGLSMNSNGLR